LKPEAYPDNVKEIRHIQTYISHVFLTGKFAYKVKKPVDYGYLDFTTLEKRKKFCERELELNRLLSPKMYLGVVAITDDNGEITVDGNGKAIEYAVKMLELPQDKMMSELLSKNLVTKEHMGQIAKIVAGFHEKAEVSVFEKKYGYIESLEFNWKENFEQTLSARGTMVDAGGFDLIKENIEKFMQEKKELFKKRINDEKIRRCHGDMHAANIFLDENEVFIFDCIEFNERFVQYDVIADVAFFSMDLDMRERHDLAEEFVRKYVELSGDNELLQLLDFYKCYYAYVRFKIKMFTSLDEKISGEERKTAQDDAKKYFELAKSYAVALEPMMA
ncbi:MAG: phosphotransferase, partial [Candidatus Aenigmarchaeota archaeon]|nr:phosphotransferase [Candidatus Aenigmarchaeota archaeon]